MPAEATRTPAPSALPIPAASQAAVAPTKWGVHLLLDDGALQWPVQVWDEHLAYAQWITGRGGYVVELIRLDDLDTQKWQGFLDLAAHYQLTPILRLATTQDRQHGHWNAPEKDPDGFGYEGDARLWARFFGALKLPARLYVVIGNEPNRGDEWGGRPNPSEYTRYLLALSRALHAARPGAISILNGGLDQYAPDTGDLDANGFRAIDASSFLDGMQASDPGVWQAIDAWASHAYPLGPFAAPPSRRDFQIDDLALGGARTRTPPWPGLYNRGLNSYRWELYKLRSFGVSRKLPVLVTETGWRHSESQMGSGDQQGAVPSGEQVADYIQLAFNGDPLLAPFEYTWSPWNTDPDVVAVALFALDGDPARWGHTNLLVLRPDGSVLGLKPELASLAKR